MKIAKLNLLCLALFLVLINLSSCSKDDDPVTDPDNTEQEAGDSDENQEEQEEGNSEEPEEVVDDTVPDDAEYWFLGDVDNRTIALFQTNSPYSQSWMSYSSGGGSFFPECNYSYGSSIGNDENPTDRTFAFEIKNLFNGYCDFEESQFQSLLDPGALPYFAEPLNDVDIKVVVTFQDETGVYSSLLGPNTNSDFNITRAEPDSMATDNWHSYRLLEGTVSCTLYHEDDPTQTMSLQNGSFKLGIASHN